MCGIAGILARDATVVDERSLRAITGALAARGPDGEGFFVDGAVGLGHRRLAIIDVAGGRQPLFSEDGQVVGVVNGEIYNFVALRAELEAAGHRFASRTDSEVIVHGYEHWGDEVLQHLEGMFALALWDVRRRRLLLARDRMGEKPLYWAALPGNALAFASELKALRHAPGFDASLDPGSLARYLVYEYIPAPATIVRGARKLEPGTFLTASPGRPPVIARYWDLPLCDRGGVGARISDGRAAAAELLDELRRSVRERLVSDVPLGVFLSGGVDSSAIAALASEARGGDLDTFSIGFDDPEFDESAHARKVAAAIGSRHHERRLGSQDLLDCIPSIGQLIDEPLGDASIVPTHLLARFARDTVTVALGGDGADELFFGYPTFQAERIATVFFDRLPPVGRAIVGLGHKAIALFGSSGGYMSFEFVLGQFLRGAGATGPRRHQAWMASFLPEAALGALAPDIARDAGQNLYDVVDRRMDACLAPDPSDRLLHHYVRGYLADDVLAKVDRATMAVGLETRSPLLGERVVTLACRLHPSLRLHGLQTKHILKRALRGVLPNETLRRKKRGFAMPIGRWLRGPLRPWLEDMLNERRVREGGLFDPAPVRQLVREHLAGTSDHRKPLWTLLAFLQWHDVWREPT